VPVPGVAAPSVPDDPAAFTAAVEALSSAFGDPTRRAIFLYVRANPGSTVSGVARAHSVHPNVARHHLDRLVAAGHLESTTPSRGDVGRPAKSYAATAAPLATRTETRLDELLVALLERSLELLGPERAEAMALEVGQAYGERLAREQGVDPHRSARGTMAAIASALTAHGFAARAEVHGGAPSVVAEACPFGEAAAHHPVLCAVDRGLVVGMLDGLGATRSAPVQMSSRARGDDACRASA
jgi:predicted ArsR family transcriptional regulator